MGVTLLVNDGVRGFIEKEVPSFKTLLQLERDGQIVIEKDTTPFSGWQMAKYDKSTNLLTSMFTKLAFDMANAYCNDHTFDIKLRKEALSEKSLRVMKKETNDNSTIVRHVRREDMEKIRSNGNGLAKYLLEKYKQGDFFFPSTSTTLKNLGIKNTHCNLTPDSGKNRTEEAKKPLLDEKIPPTNYGSGEKEMNHTFI